MQDIARKTANNASFQAFMNCYLKEVDTGVWHDVSKWKSNTGVSFDDDEIFVLEVQLESLETTIAVGVSFRSLVGRHRLTTVFQKHQNQFNWHEIDTISAILLLIEDIYSTSANKSNNASAKDHQLELIARTIESHQVMSHYLEQRLNDDTLDKQEPDNQQFIHSEQSLLFGHWLHPTPKSRQGIHAWQHQNYSPELCSTFKLHFFAVERDVVRQNSILDISAEKIFQNIAHMDLDAKKVANVSGLLEGEKDKILLAVHPLQAQWLLHQDYVLDLIEQETLIDIGLLGPKFTPTSSVRTVYCAELDYMLKLSIPVKITNSLRINMQHELDAGMLVAKLLKKCRFSEQYPQFKTIDDPAYITLDIASDNGQKRESGFEVIIRDNPFSHANTKSNNLNVQSIAALVQDPLTEETQSRLAFTINKLATQEKASPRDISLRWFDAYWTCAIESAIRLYDIHGIALEAHQQNSLLDISGGYPKYYYYRDNQGFYLSKGQQQRLLNIEPQLHRVEDLFYDDEMICDRFSYYLIVNQLFSVINRFALDQLVTEAELLEITCQKLQALLPEMQNVGKALVESILHRKEIPCKGNLLTRIEDVDELQVELELAVYTSIRNPLPKFATHYNDLPYTTITNEETLRESA